jgi:hypothetical protein
LVRRSITGISSHGKEKGKGRKGLIWIAWGPATGTHTVGLHLARV